MVRGSKVGRRGLYPNDVMAITKKSAFYHRAIWRASGRAPDWLKKENANARAVKREEEEEWGKMKWR
jgi:hypothetical protein